jgi:hypothetical protein
MRYLLILLLAGCTTVNTAPNPACLALCKNTGDMSTVVTKDVSHQPK